MTASASTKKQARARAASREQLARGGCFVAYCKNLAAEGQKRCEYHRAANARAQQLRNRERAAKGLCLRCSNRAVDGHITCLSCLEKLNARSAASKRRRRAEATP